MLDRLFGAWVENIHDGRTNLQTIDGMELEGFYGDLELTSAKVMKRFCDGRPAITEARIGRGQALLIGFDPARQCWRPGATGLEALLADLIRGESPRTWSCDVPLTLRRRCAEADHYFIIS